MHCNCSTDYAINYSSIGLNELTIHQVLNEVWLFTCCQWTHGFELIDFHFPLIDHQTFMVSFMRANQIINFLRSG